MCGDGINTNAVLFSGLLLKCSWHERGRNGVEHRRPDLVRSRSGPLAARRGPGMSQECQRTNRAGSHQRKGTERNFVKQFSDEDDCQTVRTNNKAI
jgi:hypothetical protein